MRRETYQSSLLSCQGAVLKFFFSCERKYIPPYLRERLPECLLMTVSASRKNYVRSFSRTDL